MSDTPRTNAARRKLSPSHELGYKDVAIMDEQCVELERELNETNADRLRLRKALERCLSLGGLVENPDQIRDHVDEALDTLPPPVVAKADADALADALREIINNDDGLSPELDGARKTIETYRTKYKEGNQ